MQHLSGPDSVFAHLTAELGENESRQQGPRVAPAERGLNHMASCLGTNKKEKKNRVYSLSYRDRKF